MFNKFIKGIAFVFATALLAPASVFADSIDPTTFAADLAVGESVTIEKEVVISTKVSSTLIDAHFLIDTSGSMGGQVNAAKAAATNLFNSLSASFGDVNAGVGVFSEGASLTDPDERGRAIIGSGLVTDATTFQNNVDLVTLCNPNCGGDTPESGWTGMALAGDDLAWRPGSNRFIFVFTDASAKGDLAGAQATVADNDISVVALSYGSLSTITAEYATPFGGTALAATTSADGIVADVTAGITGALAEYDTVTVGDLGNGMPEIGVSAVCTSADIGACVGAEAVGDYDRSIERSFLFDVTFTRLADGDTTFETYALVDGGIVAREIDTFGVDGDPDPDPEPEPVPEPATLALFSLGLGLIGFGAARRRRG